MAVIIKSKELEFPCGSAVEASGVVTAAVWLAAAVVWSWSPVWELPHAMGEAKKKKKVKNQEWKLRNEIPLWWQWRQQQSEIEFEGRVESGYNSAELRLEDCAWGRSCLFMEPCVPVSEVQHGALHEAQYRENAHLWCLIRAFHASFKKYSLNWKNWPGWLLTSDCLIFPISGFLICKNWDNSIWII